MNVRTRIGGFAAAAITLTVAACGNNSTPASPVSSAPTGSEMSMSTPSSSVQGSSSAPESSSSASAHNDADVMFAQMMIVHHQGAIEMADLAPDRAASSDVLELASTIKAAQTPEIDLMSSWLEIWEAPVAASSPAMGSMSGMDHGATGADESAAPMPGMMTDEQMQQLMDADGAEFDKLFLELMIIHHQGALDMAQTEQNAGQNPEALALAESIIESQTAEIADMRKLLENL